jgi:hypothetical protein
METRWLLPRRAWSKRVRRLDSPKVRQIFIESLDSFKSVTNKRKKLRWNVQENSLSKKLTPVSPCHPRSKKTKTTSAKTQRLNWWSGRKIK